MMHVTLCSFTNAVAHKKGSKGTTVHKPLEALRAYTEAALLHPCVMSLPERSKPQEGTPCPALPPRRGRPTSAGCSGFGCSPGRGALCSEHTAQQLPATCISWGRIQLHPWESNAAARAPPHQPKALSETREEKHRGPRPKVPALQAALGLPASRGSLGGAVWGATSPGVPLPQQGGSCARSRSHHTSPPPLLCLNSKPSEVSLL